MKHRTARRTIVVTMTALALLWALAPIGAAKKPPDKPGGGGGPTLAVEVVDLAGNPLSTILEAPGDMVYFRVTVDGANHAGGELCLFTTDTIPELCEPDTDGLLGPYAVQADDVIAPKRKNADDRFVGEVILSFEGDEMATSFAVPVWNYPDCAAEGLTLTANGYEGSFPGGTTCRWHPYTPGVWSATLSVSGAKPSMNVFLTLRDHVPGNWCPTSAESPAGYNGQLSSGDAVVLEYFTPEDGICLRGGLEGGFFGVGNPETFVLAVTGDLTLDWVRETP